ncbi:MAG: DUF4760 domain-containing protein [Bacteroidota bacterium]
MSATREKMIRFLVDNIFKFRFWVLFIGLCLIFYLGYRVDQNPKSELKDIVSVLTGGCVILALFYSIITYEYNQRKFKHEVKTSRETLSFNVACEWYKPPMAEYMKTAAKFYLQHKQLIEETNAKKFHDELEKEENENAKIALFGILNYLESIALAVKQEIMDEDFIKGFFATVFASNYNSYLFYIEYRRKIKQNQRI